MIKRVLQSKISVNRNLNCLTQTNNKNFLTSLFSIIMLCGILLIFSMVMGCTNEKTGDSDKDGFSDGFEKNVSHTDPLVSNDRYFLISYWREDNEKNPFTDKYLPPGRQIPAIREFLINKGEIPSKNIMYLQKPSFSEFQTAIHDISKKADGNDIVFILLNTDTYSTYKKTSDFTEDLISSELTFSDRRVSPSEIRNAVDEIHAGVVIISLDICTPGLFFDSLKGPGKIIITSVDKNQYTLNAESNTFLFEAMGNSPEYKSPSYNTLGKSPDSNGNSYISILEAFNIDKSKMANIKDSHNNYQSCNALISDPSEIAGKTYLVEYKLPTGYSV